MAKLTQIQLKRIEQRLYELARIKENENRRKPLPTRVEKAKALLEEYDKQKRDQERALYYAIEKEKQKVLDQIIFSDNIAVENIFKSFEKTIKTLS